MTDPSESTAPEVPSAAACAEAAAWIARLHGEDRTASVEAGFTRWLAASAEHRAAFEMANDIWLETEHLPKPATPAFVRWPKAGLVVTLPRALVAAAAIAIAAVGINLHSRDSGIATQVGEERNLTLQDGTLVSLNTASRIHVHYDNRARHVELDEGEAYFEVAKHPDWPFIVTAGARQVVARGTVFMVQRHKDELAVTLVEGKVIVEPAGEAVPSLLPSAAPAGASSGSFAGVQQQSGSGADVTLSPGQRLTFVDHERPKMDRPALERVTAWQRGQIILDHTPLSDAVAEMNRYSTVQMKIVEPEAERAEVTGIFRLGDSESFAQAVAETYHLQVTERHGLILVSGLPKAPGASAYEK